MAVYVDDAKYPMGRMIMCHLIADTREELFAVVDALHVGRRHMQHRNSYREHFDLCKSNRTKAIEMGAIEITSRELGQLLLARRNNTQYRRINRLCL